ncbi:hypothetical protein BD770DRAFT_428185 [Pilaira anomala]|nr:hypothetical protein BD770DRAFT_428185 [Pilaira anomala]
MDESNQKIQSSMSYVKEDSVSFLEIGRGASVTAKSSKFNSVSTLQYKMVYNASDPSEGIIVLSNTIDKASQVEINGNVTTGLLIRVIVENDQPNLKTLILKDYTFTSYTSSTSTTTVSQHIKNIIFCKCSINHMIQ